MSSEEEEAKTEETMDPPKEENQNGIEEETVANGAAATTTRRRRSSAAVAPAGGRRPSRLNSLIQVRRESMRTIQLYTEEELMGPVDDASEATSSEPSLPRIVPVSEARLRRISLRLSAYADQVGRERLVEVRLSRLSYHVPVKADAPSVATVWNATPLYKAYRFFRRVHLYRLSRHDTTLTSRTKFIPRKPSDIFLPYRRKKILNDINLVLKPGNSYLILGPPGCGKTSLLKAIAGSLPGGHAEGSVARPYFDGRIEYNGLTAEDDPNMVLPNICSYVEQRDVHAPRLTIKETFDFAFQCRTGGKHRNVGVADSKVGSRYDEEKFTESVTIESLGLAHVADTFVGDEDIRGISGGQRRRVTVGEMMQGHSPVACADEISTGLDAAVAYEICRSIVALAKAAKTTRVMSLLQPGPEIFSLFDEVIILSEGYLVYAGPIDCVVDYFEDLGYHLPATVDVADFLQSLPTPDGALYFQPPPEGSQQTHYTAEGFAEAFNESEAGQAIRDELDKAYFYKWKPAKDTTTEDVEKPKAIVVAPTPEEFQVEYQNSLLRSSKLNFARFLTLWKRDIGYIIGRFFENVGMAVATGGILFGQARIKWDQDADLDKQAAEAILKLEASVFGALYMAAFFVVQGANVNAPEELADRGIHYKHANANFYPSMAFTVGRLVATFPQRAIDIAVFGFPLYWMVGLHASASSFFIYLGLLFWLIIAEKLLFGITVALVRTKQDILGFGSFVMLLQLLFSGYIVFPDAIPPYYDWIYYLNPMAWTFQGLVLNEFLSDKYGDGEIILRTRGFHDKKAWIGWAFLFLTGLSVVATVAMSYALKTVRFEATKPKGSASNEMHAEDSEYDWKSFSLPFTPVDLTFENIEYEVVASKGKETIKILKGISGCFRAGRLCALMGSSGAGKTTLMDVIALRKESGSVTGSVHLNGFEQERTSFLRSSGYVEQFDVQSPELTVRETVAFSARLRLDSNHPELKEDEDKLRFVDSILKLLELINIEKVQVGSYDEGGLSFEQRKRLAIAVELAGSPSILFLDEPTSGLDARAAILVVRLLKRIADTGRTVCSTIHQPSSAVFEMFDDLLLLETGGRVVFCGELGENSSNLIDTFESYGVTPIEHGENPSSWMLRVLDEKDDWNSRYLSSPAYDALKEEIAEVNASPDESTKLLFTEEYPTTWKTRMQLMYKRISMIYLRSPAYNLTRVVISLFYAFILGSLFIRQAADGKSWVWTENEVEGVLGTMFLSLSIMGVTCITMVVPVMKRIRDVFYKHRASGMIEPSPLALALTVGEAPYICVITALFGAVYYGTVGLFGGLGSFGQFWLFFAFNLAVYTYLGQSFMCLVKDTSTAGALMGALIGYNVFFSGFVVRPQYFVGPFQLGYWTAPGRFAYEGLVVSQFTNVNVDLRAADGSPYFFHLGCTLEQDSGTCMGYVQDYVKFAFGGRFNNDNFWIDLGGLFGYTLLAWLLTAFALKKFNYVNT